MSSKLYVLTKCSTIGLGKSKEIIGVYTYQDGMEQKIMNESIQSDCQYVLEGPFNVNVSCLTKEIPQARVIKFPEVPFHLPEVPNHPIGKIMKDPLLN